MSRVRVFFKQGDGFTDALRASGVSYGALHQGVVFSDGVTTPGERLVMLTARDGRVVTVPTANILMIVTEGSGA